MKRILCFLLTLAMLISIVPPLEVYAAAGPAALTYPKITPQLESSGEYVGYNYSAFPCTSSMKIRWEDLDADYYNVAVKALDGTPNPGDNEPGEFLYSYTPEYPRTFISLTQSKMESAAGKWVKVFVQSVFGSESYSCHYYFRVAELGEPAPLTNPEIEPELDRNLGDYVGYYEDVVSNSSSLRIRWEDVDADSYNVAIKVLNGDPNPGDNEPGTDLYKYTTGYTKTYISLTQDQIESAAGKWIKVFVASIFGSKTFNCHYYFKVESLKDSFELNKTSVSLAWDKAAEDSIQVTGADSYSFAVEYDVPASVAESGFDYEWLNVTDTGSGLTFTPNRANYAATARTAAVTVTAGGESKTVTVTQAACGEAAPTIQLHRGSTVYADGDTIGSFLMPQEAMDVDITATNVRKVTANLVSSDGKHLDSCTSTSRITLDISNVPAGQYKIEIYASNSDTANDYWKQSPFTSEPMTLNFRLIDPNAVGSKDFSSFAEAMGMIIKEYSDDWSTVGKINYVEQKLTSGNDTYYYTDGNMGKGKGYWESDAQASGMCTRAAASMALSYLGVTAFPRGIGPAGVDKDTPYTDFASGFGCTPVKKSTPTMANFNEMYEQYANDTTGKYSPVVIHTNYYNVNAGKNSTHAVTVFGKDISDGYYYVADPGTNNILGKIKLTEVNNQLRVAYYIDMNAGDKHNGWGYSTKYTMKSIWQYTKDDAPDTPVSNLELSQNAVNMTWNQNSQSSVQVSGVNSFSVSTAYDVPTDIQNSEYDYSWLNCQRSGNTLTLTPTRPNYASTARTAVVTVTSGSQSKTITVTQAPCGEAAPTIRVFNGNTVYTDGSTLGTIQTPAEALKFSVSSTNVRKVTAYLKDAQGETLAECTDLSSLSFDLNSLPEGQYQIVIYASNSDTNNDYWKQSPFASGSMTLNFELLASHVHSYTSTVTKPTCTEQGFTTYTCECGDSYVDDYVKAIGHTEVIDKSVQATCTEPGLTEGKHCDICGEVLIPQEPISPLGHLKVTDPAAEATCTTDGLTEGAHCSDCGEILVKQEVIPAKGHSWDEGIVTIQPTDTTTGVKTFTCTVCKEIKTEIIPVLDHVHKHDSVVIQPTCTEEGYTTHTCSCGDTYADSKVPALGHAFGEWSVETEAACEEEGLKRRNCTRCDEYETVPLPALGHSFTDYVSNGDSTCTADGTQTAKCDRCDETDTQTDIGSKLEHTYGEWIVEKAATCVEKGTEIRKCINGCGASENREITELAPHSYDRHEVTEPTCTASGYTTHICIVCGHSYVDNATDPIPHTDGDGDNLCDICNSAMCAHTYDTVVTDPTCEEQGYTTYTCSACGHSYVGEYTVPMGHAYGTWTVSAEPSCEEDGLKIRTCNHCGAEETTIIAATGHTEIADEEVSASCEQEGRTGGSHCAVCGKTIQKAILIPPMGHSFGDWVTTKAATCQEPGIMTRTCHCGKTETTEIDKLDHAPVVDAAKEATCTEPGLTEGSHCEVCKTVLSEQEAIPAKGHSWDAGIVTVHPTETSTGIKIYTCTVCDEVKEEVLPKVSASIASGKCGDNLTWELTEDGTLTISGTGDMWNFLEYEAPWNSDKETITTIIIAEGVTSIGKYAFGECAKLQSLTLSDTLEIIGEKAFWGCISLETIVLPKSTRIIGKNAFAACIGLKEITIPENLETIGAQAFVNCSALEHVTVSNPDNISLVSSSIFIGCSKLKTVGPIGGGYNLEFGKTEVLSSGWFDGLTDTLISVTLPEGLTSIGTDAFRSCTELESITIPTSVKTIGSHAFSGCSSLDAIILPTSLESIGSYAFAYSAIKEILIPDSVKSIGRGTFISCGELEKVTVDSNIITSTYSEIFSHCPKLKTAGPIGGGYDVEFDSIPSHFFSNCESLIRVLLPYTLTSVSYSAFNQCTALETILIPTSVTSVDAYAFYGCENLQNVYYSGTEAQWNLLKKNIGANNEYLLNANIHFEAHTPNPGGPCGDNLVWKLDESAGTLTISGTGAMTNYVQPTDVPWYSYRSAITSVVIEPGITSIADNAFYYFRNLTSVSIPDTVGSIGFAAFSGCWKLTEIQIPEYVMIGETAFSNCSALTNLVLGEGCTLGDAVFRGCTELTTVTIPAEAKGSGVKAFDGCTKLTNVTIENGLTEIPEGMFMDCESLKEIVLPESVESIGKTAFQNCKNLGSITIPYTVARIEDNAFYECYAITDVYYGGTQGHWESLQKYIGRGNDIITASAKVHYTDEDRVIILSDHTSLSIPLGGKITLGAAVIFGAERMKDLSGLSFWVEDNSVLKLIDQKTEGDYLYLTLKGLKVGTSVVSFTDSITGFSSQVVVSVFESKTHSYTLNSVPSGEPNFYNINGLFIENYNFDVLDDRSAIVEFDVYNRSYAYAVVEIYDSNGTIVDVAIIEKMHTNNTSVKEAIWDGPAGLVKDLFEGDLLSYRQSTETKHTHIKVEIPENGYIRICTDPEESPAVFWINIVDVCMSIGEIFGDVKGYAGNNKEFLEDFSWGLVREEVYKTMSKEKYQLSLDLVKNVSTEMLFSKESLGNFLETITKNMEEMDYGKVFASTVKSYGFGLGEKALQYFTGLPGKVMGGLFTIGKIQNSLIQCIHLRKSIGLGSIYIQNQGGGSRHTEEVTVESKAGFDDDMALNVFRVSLDSEILDVVEKVNPELYQSIVQDTTHVYDISLRKNGKETQPNGEVTVYIKIPEGLKLYAYANQAKVFRVEADGTLTQMETTIRDDCFVFNTEHFSLYMITGLEENPGAAITRISGDDRCRTAIASAEQLKVLKNVSQFQIMVLADARNFPDALAGSYLAAMAEAPLLLFQNAQKTAVMEYINNNLAAGGVLYILGQKDSVPYTVEENLKSGVTAVRLAGDNRYTTCLAILEKADEIRGTSPDAVLVCTGTNFADSLSASATGMPILLVNGSGKNLTSDQKKYLENLSNAEIYVIGGKNTVSEQILNQLHSYDRSGTAERIYGDGREETSVAVAKKFFPAAKAATFAYSRNFPDGLSGGPVAYAMKAPLLLINKGAEGFAADYIAQKQISTGIIFGGTNSVPDAWIRKIFSPDSGSGAEW